MYIMGDENDEKAKGWSLAEARRSFSEVVSSAAHEPQPLYNRGRIVAAVIDADELAAFRAWKARRAAPSLADAFAQLRELCRRERYELVIPDRADRANPFSDDVPG